MIYVFAGKLIRRAGMDSVVTHSGDVTTQGLAPFAPNLGDLLVQPFQSNWALLACLASY